VIWTTSIKPCCRASRSTRPWPERARKKMRCGSLPGHFYVTEFHLRSCHPPRPRPRSVVVLRPAHVFGGARVSRRPARAATQRTLSKSRSPPPPVVVAGGSCNGVARFRCHPSASSYRGAGQHERPLLGATVAAWAWGGRRHFTSLRHCGRQVVLRQPEAAVRHRVAEGATGRERRTVKEGPRSGRGIRRHSTEV